MTTEFVVVGEDSTVRDAIDALRQFEGEVESVHVIFLTNAAGVVTGAVPLARILLADAGTPLRELSVDPVITVPAHEDEKSVVALFHKYNLVTLPVVGDSGRLVGVVTADDVLAVVVNPE
jgi:magnesium transporter